MTPTVDPLALVDLKIIILHGFSMRNHGFLLPRNRFPPIVDQPAEAVLHALLPPALPSASQCLEPFVTSASSDSNWDPMWEQELVSSHPCLVAHGRVQLLNSKAMPPTRSLADSLKIRPPQTDESIDCIEKQQFHSFWIAFVLDAIDPDSSCHQAPVGSPRRASVLRETDFETGAIPADHWPS